MNIRRWLCLLDCGHEQWVSARWAPKKTHCEHCYAEAKKEAEQARAAASNTS